MDKGFQSFSISWARLLKWVFDLERCPHCGGELKIIAATQEFRVIAKILAISACPPERRPDLPRSLSSYSKWPDSTPLSDSIRLRP